ncbi:VOC family protein [Paremcibacter congregatus]|uniref:Glyoxalase n=1 Tax=Paremcibacter congregatus TaxID=2043170 RepID=A0A2G4YTK3_9PROT|nr:VOC family protein [Paremcibacter congregatus]PHZ85669.1 glyoxalase [Paremcibacter congregatus]QDE26629.1 VOC family protein [Paremcibacter congregatus]|tara:strand:+ start:3985 stop:4368 length:384 start_codon:yes stop_codon:yes gene_type:complete
MLGYVMVGTNDLQNTAKFYDAILAEIGAKRTMDFESFVAWGTDEKSTMFSISKPNDGKPATVGNGTMMAFATQNPETVDKIYAIALELGGTCEGEPGPRPNFDPNFYAGYFRDPEGNKCNAFHYPQG